MNMYIIMLLTTYNFIKNGIVVNITIEANQHCQPFLACNPKAEIFNKLNATIKHINSSNILNTNDKNIANVSFELFKWFPLRGEEGNFF